MVAIAYLAWAWKRLRDCLDTRGYPYERLVCLAADEWGRDTCVVGGAAFLSAPVWLGWVLGYWPAEPWATAALAVTAAYLAHRGGWLGGFLWADLGPEERVRELAFGGAMVPLIAPNCTKESFCGFYESEDYSDAENADLMRAWNEDKFLVPRRPDGSLARYFGDPGSGRFDVLAADEQTWAVRAHHRWIRPRLVRRGVPGYGR